MIGFICGSPAHPRSRGENRDVGRRRVAGVGSSPLTRGKLPDARRMGDHTRLIPAHAGKTAAASAMVGRPSAHPRSRGENSSLPRLRRRLAGSSPLTRGKLVVVQETACDVGLIPAHAGKTGGSGRHSWQSPAHPRSRGENETAGCAYHRREGSSPLTRGKPWFCRGPRGSSRLIPAHAGKTRKLMGEFTPAQAHPRSRGENWRCGCP